MFIRTRIAVSKLGQAALCRLPSSSLRVLLVRSTLALSTAGKPCATKPGRQQPCAGALEQSARRRGQGDAGSVTFRSLADLIRVTLLFRMFLTRFSTPLFGDFLVFHLLPPPQTSYTLAGSAFSRIVPPRTLSPGLDRNSDPELGLGIPRATISFGSGENCSGARQAVAAPATGAPGRAVPVVPA